MGATPGQLLTKLVALMLPMPLAKSQPVEVPYAGANEVLEVESTPTAPEGRVTIVSAGAIHVHIAQSDVIENTSSCPRRRRSRSCRSCSQMSRILSQSTRPKPLLG